MNEALTGDPLTELIVLSQRLGEPALDLVILGEGNTSVRADEESFWVKASGTQLATADRDTFVRVAAKPVLGALDGADLSDEQIRSLLQQATLEGRRAPSIETFLHALCLQLDGVRFVAHTHPTDALALLCSRKSRELFTGSLFPDQIVLLGSAPVYVPYADPGLPIAALPCGSRSTSNTLCLAAARAAAKFTLVVVLPTPPF